MSKKKEEIKIHWENFIKAIMVGLDIPTRKDIKMLQSRIHELEKLVKAGGADKVVNIDKNLGRTAISVVFDEISKYPEGVNYKTIKKATGFEERKLRNIIFRLTKLNKIQSLGRGKYIEV